MYKTEMKENEKHTHTKRKVFWIHWLILLKCPYYSKEHTDSIQSLLKQS
jgi:hypothetical protein